VIEAVAYVGRRHRGHTRRCKLDGQRNPVEASATLRHRVGLGHRHLRRHTAGALDEQIDRRLDVQRWHRPLLLIGQAQSFSARVQNPSGGRARPNDFNQIGRGVEDMLTVVEHQ
jgi:hypothetical protein